MLFTLALQIVVGLLVLSILVIIHEGGHFLAAKSFGIKVLSFSVGFGKVILKKSFGGTEYRISSVPFGGYVHMAGEHPEDDSQGSDDEFSAKPVWQRAIVAFSGPFANIVTALFFLWIVFLNGEEKPFYIENSVVGAVRSGSIAQKIGIVPGDTIVTIDGKNVKNWDDIHLALATPQKSNIITVKRRNSIISFTILRQTEKDITQDSPLGLYPCFPADIAKVIPGSQAYIAGFKAGDKILAVDNETIFSWYQILDKIASYTFVMGEMQFIVMRGDSAVVLTATPKYNSAEKRYMLGISVATPKTHLVKYSPFGALKKAVQKSMEYTLMIFTVFSKLFSGAVSPKNLAGPIGIVQMSGSVAFMGVVSLLNFMALIGINLGVMNLLPLVITDGGVLFFLLIEAIRKKPLSLKTQLLLNKIFIAFFIGLFFLVTYNDILRIPKIMGL